MRLLRAITTMLGALALGAVALPGQAGAAQTAPYTALTVNGRFSLAFDAGDSSVYQGAHVNGNEYINFSAYQPGHNASIQIFSKYGSKIIPGTYSTAGGPSTTNYGLSVGADGFGCGEKGTVVVKSVTRTGAGAIASIAASYVQCEGTYSESDLMYGEFRWNSADGFTDTVQTTSSIDAGTAGLGQRTPSQTVTFTGTGSTPLKPGAVSFTGASAASWKLDGNGCAGKTLAYGQSCSVSVSAQPQMEGALNAKLRIADNSSRGFREVVLSAAGRRTAAGNFFPLGPTRILDTRSGLGVPTGRLGPQQSLSLQVAGVAGVPASGVAAVMLNVTVANATSGSFLSAFPGGTARPTVSNLNFAAGWVGANSVTVPVGANGKVDIYNELGSVDVIADLLGFYLAADTLDFGEGGQFRPHNTFRAADTRDPGWGGPLPGGWSMSVVVDYNVDGVHNPHVKALAVNVTAVTPQGFGYLTAWNGLSQPPLASTLNFTAGSVVPNFAVVPTSTCTASPACAGMPEIDIYNGSAKPTHVIVDVVGYFDDAQDGPGFRFHPLTPSRIGDTRTQLGGPATLGPNSTATFTVPAALRTAGTGALVANVTGVNRGGAATYLTAYADGEPKPFASNLNLAPYDVRPNAAFVLLGESYGYHVYNAASTADVVVDVAGRFDLYSYPPQASATSTGATASPATPTAGPTYPYVAG